MSNPGQLVDSGQKASQLSHMHLHTHSHTTDFLKWQSACLWTGKVTRVSRENPQKALMRVENMQTPHTAEELNIRGVRQRCSCFAQIPISKKIRVKFSKVKKLHTLFIKLSDHLLVTWRPQWQQWSDENASLRMNGMHSIEHTVCSSIVGVAC